MENEPELTENQSTAIRRWKLGHHVFHLYLVAMNRYLQRLNGTLETTDWSEVPGTLDVLTRLYDSATAAMHYAADFPQDESDGLIRPSMGPPYLNEGFSGHLNADHDKMLKGVKAARKTLKESARVGENPQEIEEAAARLFEAQAHNRAAHKLICEKFVPGGKSLLKQYFQENAA